MKIKYIFIVLLLSAINIFSQTGSERHTLSYPEFIPVNSLFDISLITSAVPGSGVLFLNITSDKRLQLNSAELRSVYGNSKLDYSGNPDDGYQLSIDLNALSLDQGGIYFQILTTFKSENILKAKVYYQGTFTEDGIEKESFGINSSELSADLNFYKPYRTAGKSLSFKENSLLEIGFNENAASNLLAEFWLKVFEPEMSLMQIINKHTEETGYNVVLNSSQMLTVQSSSGRLETNPVFISKRTWNFVSILIDEQQRRIDFYCNDILFFRDIIPGVINIPDLIIRFKGRNKESFQISNFRIVDLKEEIELSSKNKHHENFKSDSSNVIAYFNSGNKKFFSSSGNINSENISIVRSDAPIFPEAPEINVSIYSNTILISWTDSEYKNAASYILERSYNNSHFIPVFTTTADRSTEKSYLYTDSKDESKSIVYYRLKQINNDGSYIYSPELKVGFGITAPFSIQQNFPNPFNPKTSIIVDIIEDSDVEIKVYNLEGEQIISLHKGFLQKGIHKFEFDASHLPSGIYLCKVSTDDYSEIRKMILAK